MVTKSTLKAPNASYTFAEVPRENLILSGTFIFYFFGYFFTQKSREGPYRVISFSIFYYYRLTHQKERALCM